MALNIYWREDREFGSRALRGMVGDTTLFFILKESDINYRLHSILFATPLLFPKTWDVSRAIRHESQDYLKQTAENSLARLIKNATENKTK